MLRPRSHTSRVGVHDLSTGGGGEEERIAGSGEFVAAPEGITLVGQLVAVRP